MNDVECPDFVTDEMLEYLDDLRESGRTNMWGASPYVGAQFGLTIKNADQVVFYWMKTFSARHGLKEE